jgi:RNA-binding proteins (RRM domain)
MLVRVIADESGGDGIGAARLRLTTRRGSPPAADAATPQTFPFMSEPFEMKSIYVGNLPFSVSENDLRQLFGEYGAVAAVKMIEDRETGRFRGFAFVEMDDADALAAIEALDGNDMSGRTLKVNEARPREARPRDSRPRDSRSRR